MPMVPEAKSSSTMESVAPIAQMPNRNSGRSLLIAQLPPMRPSMKSPMQTKPSSREAVAGVMPAFSVAKLIKKLLSPVCAATYRKREISPKMKCLCFQREMLTSGVLSPSAASSDISGNLMREKTKAMMRTMTPMMA